MIVLLCYQSSLIPNNLFLKAHLVPTIPWLVILIIKPHTSFLTNWFNSFCIITIQYSSFKAYSTRVGSIIEMKIVWLTSFIRTFLILTPTDVYIKISSLGWLDAYLHYVSNRSWASSLSYYPKFSTLWVMSSSTAFLIFLSFRDAIIFIKFNVGGLHNN